VHQPTPFHRNRVSALAALGATALLISACANTGSGPTTAATTAALPTATTEATMEASEAPMASEAAQAYEVDLAEDAKLGKFLTGEDGMTLYLFTPDTTSASNCNGDCASTWPPFTLEDGETVKGGDGVAGTFATIKRQDGSEQVTYAGHPLYYYSGDQAAGDTKGQGLFSKWYVVGADGNAIKTASSGRY
jgi:predicted lipoprotein with Yx(FWY)xxD motif